MRSCSVAMASFSVLLLFLSAIVAVVLATSKFNDHEETVWFNQTLDHFDALNSGLWRQRYYVNSTFFSSGTTPTTTTASNGGTTINGSGGDDSTTTVLTTAAAAAVPPPLFFIPGGEWSLGPEKGILYGMTHDLAREHGGLMAAAEHRFYGASLPYGTVADSFQASASHLGLLSLEQAMADYAAIIREIISKYYPSGTPRPPVVLMGGSYSGKLSAYMRHKYPELVSIALAASAPIYLDSVGMTEPTAYYKVVENATSKIRPKCNSAVKRAFTAYRVAKAKANDTRSRTQLQHALGLCAPMSANDDEFGWDPLEFYLTQYFATMAMFNYPPSSSPLATACDHVLGAATTISNSDGSGSSNGNYSSSSSSSKEEDEAEEKKEAKENKEANEEQEEEVVEVVDDVDDTPLSGLRRLLAALRRPANATCFNLTAQAPGNVPAGPDNYRPHGSVGSVACSDWSGCGPAAGGLAWDYQACTEVIQNLGIAQDSTMFLPHPWSLKWMKEHCQRRFGVSPRPYHLRDTMGLDDLRSWPQPARIIFSNGLQDPWHAGGVLHNVTDTMVAITIPNGAHHQDLNGGEAPNDTKDMLEARRRERALIASWLVDVRAELHQH